MEDISNIVIYKRYVRVMLSAVKAVEDSCRQLRKPLPNHIEVKKYYYGLAQKQLDKNDLVGCRAMLEEMKNILGRNA
jgi:hypothetical protein